MPRTTHFTLTSGAVRAMVVDGRGPVRIINRGTSAIFVRADRDPNTGLVFDPVVSADDCFVVAAGAVRMMDCADEDGHITVKVIGTAAVDVTLEIAEQIGMGY